MKKIRTTALLLAVLLAVMCLLCSCGGSGSAGQEPVSSTIGSGEGYSSSAGVDMSSSSAAEADQPKTGTREVRFKDDNARSTWDTLYQDRYVYFWSDSDNKMTEWPGEKMQKNSGGYYTYTIPQGAAYIIFNAGTDLYQSVDIPFDGTVTDFQLTGERDSDADKFLVETWDGGSIAEVVAYESTKTVGSSEMGISIEGITVQKGYFDGSFVTNGGTDGIIFKLKNNLSEPVKSVTMYAVFLDSSGKAINTNIVSYNDDPIVVLTTTDSIIQPGETHEVTYKCNAEGIVKQEAIVASYNTSGKVRYVNADAESWAANY